MGRWISELGSATHIVQGVHRLLNGSIRVRPMALKNINVFHLR